MVALSFIFFLIILLFSSQQCFSLGLTPELYSQYLLLQSQHKYIQLRKVFTKSREEKDIQLMKSTGQQLDELNFSNSNIEESQHCSQCDQFIATLKQREEEILSSSAPGKYEMIADLDFTIKAVEDMRLINY